MILAILLMLWDFFEFLTISSQILFLYMVINPCQIWQLLGFESTISASTSVFLHHGQLSQISSSFLVVVVQKKYPGELFGNKFYCHILRSDDDLSILLAR